MAITRRPSRRRTACPRCPFDLLERRQLLSAAAASAVVAETTWRVSGAKGSDAIVVEADPADASRLRATVNGAVLGTVPLAGLSRVEVLAGRGNDTVTTNLGRAAPGVAVLVRGGAGNDRLVGSTGREDLRGDAGADRLDAGGGDDALDGGGGNDDLLGGDGDDRMLGGAGRDVLAGGYGRDSLKGGAGRDRLDGGTDDDALQPDKADRPADVLSDDPASAPLPRPRDNAELKQWLIDAAVEQWSWAYGQPAWEPWAYYLDFDGGIVARGAPGGVAVGAPAGSVALLTVNAPGGAAEGGAGGAPVPAAPPPVPAVGSPAAGGGGGGSAVAPDASGTNVQVQGVDEADLVETDGQYLYVLRPGEVQIVSAAPPDAMAVVARAAVEGAEQGIYLHGSRLTVVSQVGLGPSPWMAALAGLRHTADDDPGGQAPAAPRAKVTVFDVSDVSHPSVVEETYLDGVYSTSRLVDDRLYVVVHNDAWMPQPATVPAPEDGGADTGGNAGGGGGGGATIPSDFVPPPGGPGASRVYESEASYRARLEAMPLEELLPGYASKAGGRESSGLLVSAPDAYVRDAGGETVGQNLTTLALLDVADATGGPTASTTVAGAGGTVYASADAMYLAGSLVNDAVPLPFTPGAPVAWFGGASSATRLLKFGLRPDAVPLLATGQVEGTTLNQFAMDESDGHFRIATQRATFSPESGGGIDSAVTVLDQSGDDLAVVGSVGGLGQNEALRAVRFVGDRGYVVTFRNIDPLFVLDLHDPTAPELAGQLEIPGFSEYLHPVGDELLIGLGRDTDDQGGATLDTGLQVSLFDVSDPANPKRVAVQKLAGRWERSAAEADHHAFSYFSEQRVLALAASRLNSGDALVVLRVDPGRGANAFEVLGDRNTPSLSLRTVRIADVLYSVEAQHVEALKLLDPDTVLGTLETPTA